MLAATLGGCGAAGAIFCDRKASREPRDAPLQPMPGVRCARALGCRTARSWRGIVPFTHLAREGRMTVTIGRRELLVALGGAAAAWPLAAQAQQGQRMRRIGLLTNLASDDPAQQSRVLAFAQALAQSGWTEGRNVRIDIRWGATDPERVRRYA